jgi:lysophospholipase L1-like esterase
MKIQGERILLFGDSLLHHSGAKGDSSPEIWDVNLPSNRVSAEPGDLLASLLLENGANAVRTNANISRSAYNFWLKTAKHQYHSANDLIAADNIFQPTVVVIMLGTNDMDVGNRRAEALALEKIKAAYAKIPTVKEIWAVGPPIFADGASQFKAEGMYELLREVFGADRVIDARPLSTITNRAHDGVHFAPIGAAEFAYQLLEALKVGKAVAAPSALPKVPIIVAPTTTTAPSEVPPKVPPPLQPWAPLAQVPQPTPRRVPAPRPVAPIVIQTAPQANPALEALIGFGAIAGVGGLLLAVWHAAHPKSSPLTVRPFRFRTR